MKKEKFNQLLLQAGFEKSTYYKNGVQFHDGIIARGLTECSIVFVTEKVEKLKNLFLDEVIKELQQIKFIENDSEGMFSNINTGVRVAIKAIEAMK